MRDETAPMPLQKYVDLSRTPEAGFEIHLEPQREEYGALADWAGVETVEEFSASVDIKKLSPTRFRYHARIDADLTQNCVVTLDPVPSHISCEFTRELHLVRQIRGADHLALVAPADDDAPEEIEDPRFDVARPVLEEFVLAVEPYPRAPGVEFEPPEDGPAPENPFSVLAKLKQGG